MTPEELERRRNVVGASEAALLFGLPSYGGRTVSDLWWVKKYGTERESKGNASTDLGTKLEPTVLEWAEKKLDTRIIDRQRWCVKGYNAATLDGRLEGNGAVIDAKTSGILGPHKLDEWGEDGTDVAPDGYIIQIMTQMLVTGAELGYLAALIGGRGFAMFEIHPHTELMAAIKQKSEAFIESLAGDIAPQEVPQLETLKRLRRQPSKVLERDDEIEELWDRLERVKTRSKKWEKSTETIQRQLLAKLGDAEAAATREGMITYYEQTRKETVQAASTFRVLRFKKGS